MFQETGVVRSISRIRPAIFRLVVKLPGVAKASLPGQFLHLKVEGVPGVLLRRPFSIAAVTGGNVEILVKIVGPGTERLSQLKKDDSCDAIGPLGGSFQYESPNTAVLVGGSIGAAPLLFLQDKLLKTGHNVHFFLGARTHSEFPLEEGDISKRSIVPCTDDGSFGEAGFVSTVFRSWLDENRQKNLSIYSCGPIPMMKEVSRICEEYSLHHQVSLENRMGCGIGVCQGCAMRLRNDSDRGGFRLICKDGPVFDATQIDWSLVY